MDSKGSNERILSLARAHLSSDKISFISQEDIQVPNFSLKRAWAHKYKAWKHDKVFKIPLFYSDHIILSILSVSIIPFVLSTLLLFNSDNQLLYICYWISCILFTYQFVHFIENHLKEVIDGYGVFYNAKKYIKNPDSVTIKEIFLKYINNSFIELTGWEVVFTDSPHILVWPQLDKKRIIMSIGWIIADEKKRDRRFAYLMSELRIIRHSIEELENKKTTAKYLSRAWLKGKKERLIGEVRRSYNRYKKILVFI
ncbi:MAG: hypothetical protein KKH08_02460 [Candidatus Omnitrophica bacterium]|nr:hypothetical protein [Candidatus Omnitrophota bacterium]